MCYNDNSIPIYNVYMKKLNKVNEMIDYVQDELNDYFYKLFNENTNLDQCFLLKCVKIHI